MWAWTHWLGRRYRISGGSTKELPSLQSPLTSPLRWLRILNVCYSSLPRKKEIINVLKLKLNNNKNLVTQQIQFCEVGSSLRDHFVVFSQILIPHNASEPSIIKQLLYLTANDSDSCLPVRLIRRTNLFPLYAEILQQTNQLAIVFS